MNEYSGESLRLDIVGIGHGERHEVNPPAGEEAIAVLLGGTVRWCTTSATRGSVFDQRASAAYVPPGHTLRVEAGNASEIAVVTTLGAGLEPSAETIVTVGPEDVVTHERGSPGWRRSVYEVAVDQVPARVLMVGETVNAPGEWSSYPPHKHDGRDGEPALEEVYYYRFDRPNGFGFQGLYDGDGGAERAVFLRDRSVVGFTHGYHPVCAAPGYRVYYLWALAGSPRRLAMHEDPAHTWLH